MNKYNIDLSHVLVKPLYMGLLINIFIPVLILGIAYYLESERAVEARMSADDLNIFFWALAAVAIVDGGIAIILKQKRFFAPMIKSKETFADDFAAGAYRISILCYALTSSISLYGLVFYVLGGTLAHLFFFVFVSFIAFQLIRPRLGFLEKSLAAQEKHVEEGRFAGSMGRRIS